MFRRSRASELLAWLCLLQQAGISVPVGVSKRILSISSSAPACDLRGCSAAKSAVGCAHSCIAKPISASPAWLPQLRGGGLDDLDGDSSPADLADVDELALVKNYDAAECQYVCAAFCLCVLSSCARLYKADRNSYIFYTLAYIYAAYSTSTS